MGSSPRPAFNRLGGLNLHRGLGRVSSQENEKGIAMIKCLAQALVHEEWFKHPKLSKQGQKYKPEAGPGGGGCKVDWARALPVGSGENLLPDLSQCP